MKRTTPYGSRDNSKIGREEYGMPYQSKNNDEPSIKIEV